ncbi:FixG Ig-like domain-containing protein, partial [Tenacibaculum piscium]
CDHMMEKVGLPKGLIRFASEENIEKKTPFEFTARMKGYTAVLGILIAVLIGMLFLRNDVEATILRLPGQLYQHKKGNIISNIYTYKVINKTTKQIDDISYKILSHKGKIETVTHQNFQVPKQGLAQGTLFIEMHQSEMEDEKVNLRIGVYSGDKLIETTQTNFLGPRSYR